MKRSILLGLTASSLTAAAGNLSADTTITIDRGTITRTSDLRLGVTHTNPALDSNYGVVPASVARARTLMTGVPKLNNIHLSGFGTSVPKATQSSPYDWTSLDSRLASIDALTGDKVLTLCSAPGWMKEGAKNDDGTFQPGVDSDMRQNVKPAMNAAYAQMSVDALLHAKAIGKSFKYVQVWNEFKGYYDATNPSLDIYKSWDVPAYTTFYNTIYDKIRATPGLEDVKIGGLYYQVTGSGSKTMFGYDGDGTWDPLDPAKSGDREVIKYWLNNKHGADFMTIDRGLIDNADLNAWQDGQTAPDKYSPDKRIQLASSAFDKTFAAVKQVMDANGAANLPLWMSEYYGLQRFPNETATHHISQSERDHFLGYGTDKQEAALNALFYKSFVENGLDTALMWNGGEGESHHGLYTDIRDVNDYGDSTPGTGGYKTDHYDVYKNINEYFGAGRPIVSVTGGDKTKVDALASTRMAMLINKTGVTQSTNVNGRILSLAPYQVRMTTLLPTTLSLATTADFDANFKEGATNSGIYREATTGKLRVGTGGVGMAVIDMRASGGVGGAGGTDGIDANNDLDNFSISARVRTTAFSDTSQAGFLFRLDENEAMGYLALASFDSATGIRLRLYEGVSLSAIPANPIFDNDSSRAGLTDIAVNTDYSFRVTAEGAKFTFDWLSSAGTLKDSVVFTDPSLTKTIGQAGIRLRAGGTATYMDEIKLGLTSAAGSGTLGIMIAEVPEPTLIGALAGLCALTLVSRRRCA